MQTIKFNKLDLKEDDLLLDMGCGEGRHTIGAYIEQPVNSFGFDLSYEDLKVAKDRLNDFDISNKKELIDVEKEINSITEDIENKNKE